MPKMKTNRAAAKRLRVTGSGKVKRGKAGKRHLMRGKARSRLRKLKQGGLVASGDQYHAERLIPYKF